LFERRVARAKEKTNVLRRLPGEDVSQGVVVKSEIASQTPRVKTSGSSSKSRPARKVSSDLTTKSGGHGTDASSKTRRSTVGLPQRKRRAIEKGHTEFHNVQPKRKRLAVDKTLDGVKQMRTRFESPFPASKSSDTHGIIVPLQKPATGWLSSPPTRSRQHPSSNSGQSSEVAKWRSRCQKLEKKLDDERRKNLDLVRRLESWWDDGSRSLHDVLDEYGSDRSRSDIDSE
jgi:hypothetical protein